MYENTKNKKSTALIKVWKLLAKSCELGWQTTLLTSFLSGRNARKRHHFEIESLPKPKLVHYPNNLERQLVLLQIISNLRRIKVFKKIPFSNYNYTDLVNGGNNRAVGSEEVDLERQRVGGKVRTAASLDTGHPQGGR